MNKIIDESIEAVKRMKASAKNAAYETLKNDILKEDILADLHEGKNDGVSTGNDQPSNFDPEGGQKRIKGVGSSLENEGDGPAIIEDEEPEVDSTLQLEKDEDEKDEKVEEGEEGEEGKEDEEDKKKSDDEDDLDLDLNSVVEELDDNPFTKKNDEKPEMKKESEEEEKEKEKEVEKIKKENFNLKKENAKLKVENSNLSKALKFATNKINEATLINQKMAYISDILSKYPGLKVESKKKIMNKFDSASTLKEAKNVYQIYIEALKEVKPSSNSNKLTEAKKIVSAANKNTLKNSELMIETYNTFAKQAGIE